MIRFIRAPHPAAVLAGFVSLAAVVPLCLADPPLAPAYTPAQQRSADEALKQTLASLDTLDGQLLAAYGGGGSHLRFRLSRSMHAAEGVFTRHIDKPNELARKDGEAVIQRIARLDPITKACGASREVARAAGAVAQEAASLLMRRGLATAVDIDNWRQIDAGQGGQRTTAGQVLDCASARKSLEGSRAALQSAYEKLHAAREEQPQGVVVSRAPG